MRSVLIVILDVGLDDEVQLSEAEAEEVIEALVPQLAVEALYVAVGDRGSRRRQDGPAIVAAEMPIKCRRELAVAVMEQEPDVDTFFVSPHAGVAGLLLHPFARGIAGAGREEDLPATEMDER